VVVLDLRGHEGRDIGLHPGQHPLAVAELAEADAEEARGDVPAADIQTANLFIQPNYQRSSQVPAGYEVSESLTATLNNLRAAGAQIQAAGRAGGNATTVDGCR
jgi:uncharacterized protein YggE